MFKLSPDYVVGLIDGEGSFTVYIRNPKEKISSKRRKRRAKAEPRFYVKLVAKDKEILYTLKKFFGCGNVYLQKDKRVNHQDCYRYEVANRRDLKEIIIPFFKKHPLRVVSKRRDFEIFCDLMGLIERGDHLNRKGLERLYKLKQRMH
jgi:hypothetical protein